MLVSRSEALVTSFALQKSELTRPDYSQCQPGAATTTPATSPTTTAGSGGSTVTPELNALAQAAGKKYFGSATDNPELTDTAYVKYAIS